MIHLAFTVYDRKALVYSPPFFAVADGAAVRMFQDLVGDTSTQVGRHPADFVLYRCGRFNDSNGEFEHHELMHLVDAMSLVAQQPPLPFDPPRRTGPQPNGSAEG